MTEIKPISFQASRDGLRSLISAGAGSAVNQLSMFSREPMNLSGGKIKLTDDLSAIARHPLFPSIQSILTQPDLRITHRYGGSSVPLNSFSAYASRAAGSNNIVVVFPLPDAYAVRLFDSAAAYIHWWASLLSGGAAQPSDNALTSTMNLETVVYLLHALDSFRRVRYQGILNYNGNRDLYIRGTEFASTMPRAMASRDPHWLLSMFLTLTPGLEKYELEPEVGHVMPLVDAGILIPSRHSRTGEDVFYFGDAGEALGDEFFRSWDLAAGFEVEVQTPQGAMSLLNGFLAPTRIANHLITIERARTGNVEARHHCLTSAGLLNYMQENLLSGLDAVKVLDAMQRASTIPTARKPRHVPKRESAAPAKAVEPSRPVKCAGCGQMNPKGMKFCGACGNKLGAAVEVKRPPQNKPKPAGSGNAKKISPAKTEPRKKGSKSRPTATSNSGGAHPLPRNSVAVSWTDMEVLARELDESMRSGRLTAEEYKGLHAGFRARDESGRMWTVGLKTLKWHRSHAGGWLPDMPPARLFMDDQIVTAIRRLRPKQSSGSRSNDPLPGKTGKAAQFDRLKTALDVAYEKTSEAGAPGSTTTQEEPTRKTAVEAVCPNPRCGKKMPAGKKFCTGCGTRLNPA